MSPDAPPPQRSHLEPSPLERSPLEPSPLERSPLEPSARGGAPVPPGVAGDQDEAARAALEATVTLSLRVLRGAMLVLAALFLGSGLFKVDAHEVALVRRLGRVQGSLEERVLSPGAHWAWPVLDEVVKVPTRPQELATDAFALEGVGTAEANQRTGGSDPERDGYLVTGDANIVHATLAASYQVVDAHALALRAQDDGGAEGDRPGLARAASLARPLLERAAVRAAARHTVDELLTTRKELFLEEVRAGTQEALERLAIGLRVVGVTLSRDLTPPPQVRREFESVETAVQRRDRLRSEARTDAARIHGSTVSDAAQRREQARSDARRLLGDVQADAAVFKALLPEWQRDRAGLSDRLLRDALASVRSEEVFLVRPGEGVKVRLERDQKDIREKELREAKGEGR